MKNKYAGTGTFKYKSSSYKITQQGSTYELKILGKPATFHSSAGIAHAMAQTIIGKYE